MSIFTQFFNPQQSWQSRVTAMLARWRIEQAILHAAYHVAKRYPTWNEMLFDHHFLLHRGRPIIERHLAAPAATDAIDLALAWVEQWPRMSSQRRKTNVQTVTPIAAVFLCQVAKQVGTHVQGEACA